VEKAAQKVLREPSERLVWLDLFRGTAILLMIVFHLFYDLSFYGFIHQDFIHDLFWRAFRWLIVWIFLLSVGISLVLVHGRGIRWSSVGRRIGWLGASAAGVSLVTWWLFPDSWVYFGILHFILLASVAALPFVGHPLLSLVAGLAVLVGWSLGWVSMEPLFSLLSPLFGLPAFTRDLVPFVPWFGVVLLGVAFASAGWHRVPLLVSVEASGRAMRTVAFMGRHALVIYLLHLPILFGAVLLLHLMLHG
jgi:uncharacterized membrane protein